MSGVLAYLGSLKVSGKLLSYWIDSIINTYFREGKQNELTSPEICHSYQEIIS